MRSQTEASPESTSNMNGSLWPHSRLGSTSFRQDVDVDGRLIGRFCNVDLMLYHVNHVSCSTKELSCQWFLSLYGCDPLNKQLA